MMSNLFAKILCNIAILTGSTEIILMPKTISSEVNIKHEESSAFFSLATKCSKHLRRLPRDFDLGRMTECNFQVRLSKMPLLVFYIHGEASKRILKKISKCRNISSLRWMIISDETAKDELISNLMWHLDNQMTLIISANRLVSFYDVYRSSVNISAKYTKLSSMPLESAENIKNLLFVRNEPWGLRTNLSGLTLRCSTMNYDPYVRFKNDDMSEMNGIVVDIWKVLETVLNFKTVCHKSKDGKWGTYDKKTKKWDGIISELVRKEVDVAMAPYVMSVDRALFIDFTHAIDKSHSSLLIKRPGTNEGSSYYTREFSNTSWLLVFILFLTSIGVCFGLNRRGNKRRESVTFPDNIFLSFKILCNLGYGDEVKPKTLSSRIWLISLLLTILVLHVYYSAFLITIFASPSLTLPIKGLEDLHNARDTWTFGVTKDSYLEEQFRNPELKMFKDLADIMLNENPEMLENEHDGVNRVKNSKKHAYLIFRKRFIYRFMTCDCLLLPERVLVQNLGIPLQKNGAVNKILNARMAVMIESGIIRKITSNYFSDEDKILKNCDVFKIDALSLEVVGSLFLLLAIAAAVSVVVLAVEKLVKRSFGLKLKN